MPARSLRKNARRRSAFSTIGVEFLESRQMLTVSGDTIVKPMLDVSPMLTGSSVSGYTPAQIKKAYGFDQIALSGVNGDGAGQTIAIIGAYNDPNIASDLHVFDQQFGLTDPVLQKVSQTGGSADSLTTDTGWAAELSLDVEWAHAIAPKAKILLVEANDASLSNLMKAVDYARNVPDVSVVSMSWGGSEFWGETTYDQYFTTPAGHQGITFVAASGDNGSWWGPSWPASSPNVLAVGGTSLNLNGTEGGWSGSGGGISEFESTPSYQSGVQGTGARTSPDVAFNADPYSGFAVYDSFGYQGRSGWSIIGGTSAGAPQWAALLAIANQARVGNGLGTLNGSTDTLPMLYALYHDPTAYAANFNDITSGRSSYFLGSHVGYDGVTGLGTPKANSLVASLSKAPINTITTGGTTTTDPTSSSSSNKRTYTPPRVSRRTAATPPPVTTTTPVISVPLAPVIRMLSLTGNSEVFNASSSPATLVGTFAGAASVFNSDSFTKTSVAILAETFAKPAARLPQLATVVGESAPAAAPGVISRGDEAPSMDQAAMTHALPQVAAAVAPRLFQFARIDWFNAFADAWGALADESASAAVRTNMSRIKAWTITAGVAAMDLALVAYWYVRRRKSKQAAAFAVGHGPENPAL